MSEIILDNLFCLIKRLIYIDTHAHTHAAEEAPKNLYLSTLFELPARPPRSVLSLYFAITVVDLARPTCFS